MLVPVFTLRSIFCCLSALSDALGTECFAHSTADETTSISKTGAVVALVQSALAASPLHHACASKCIPVLACSWSGGQPHSNGILLRRGACFKLVDWSGEFPDIRLL